MTCLVLCHLVNRVVNSIKTQFLSHLSDVKFGSTSTFFRFHSLLQVGLRVPNHLAKQFSKTRSVVSLLVSIATESLRHFGIALAVCLTSHCQIHTYFTTLTIKVVFQALKYKCTFLTFWNSLSHAYFMFTSEIQSFSLFLLFELRARNLALWTLLWRVLALINIPTHGAYPFFSHKC